MTTERQKKSFFRRDDAESREQNEGREESRENYTSRDNRDGGRRGYDNERTERFERKPHNSASENGRGDWKPRHENSDRRSSSGDRNNRGEHREWKPRRDDNEHRPWQNNNRDDRSERRPWNGERNSSDGERREWKPRRDDSDRKPWGGGERRESGERREWNNNRDDRSERRPWNGERNSSDGERREWKPRREDSDRKPWGGGNSREPRNDRDGFRTNRYSGQSREWEPRFDNDSPRAYQTRERRNKKSSSKAPYVDLIDSDPKAPVRLNRFIAMSGICSRREADILITEGQVTVNGTVVDQLGAKVTREDRICLNGELLRGERKVYIIMNKPKGYVTTTDDPHADRTVIDLLKGEVKERVYPVGRLDKNTTGVLLLTNDGELTNQLTHPSYEKRKLYHVFLNKPCTEDDIQQLLSGIELEDGEIKADAAEFVNGTNDEIGVEIHSGRNRIVRRMFEHLGYEVVKLDRVYFAGFTKMGLRRGFWRHLTPREVASLRGGSYQ